MCVYLFMLSSPRAEHARALNNRQGPTVGPSKDFQGRKPTSALKWPLLENEKRHCDGFNGKSGHHAQGIKRPVDENLVT